MSTPAGDSPGMGLDPQTQVAWGIVRITTGGIQDLAALIPLLTTEVCEKHVNKALKKGLLYAAAAPMTIFGSLGIAKAGFIALCASIDHPFFHGPALLKNAGFRPIGMGKMFLHVKHEKHHLYKAEDKLRRLLNKKKVWEVNVNLRSRDFWWWNVRLASATIFLCLVGLLPWIFLIHFFLPDLPVHQTWLFPVLHICGSGLVAVNIQFLFQLRLIEEAYYRLRFIAADTYLKHIGKCIPTQWDPNERSKKIFNELRLDWLPLHEEEKARTPPRHRLNDDDKLKILDNSHKLASFDFYDASPPPPSGTATPNPDAPDTRHQRRGSETTRKGTVEFDAAEQGVTESESEAIPTPTVRVDTTSSSMSTATKMGKAILWVTRQFTTLVLWCTQLTLSFGIICIIFGYIGCFTVIQLRAGWKGPLVWFVSEVLLSFTRTIIWAANPDWDDAKLPIVLEKRPHPANVGDPGPGSSSYGIGWSLDSPTADDMHAVIVGIDVCNTTDFDRLDKARSDAESVAKYLEEYLLVPRSQIRTLYDADATRGKIVEELKSLRHRGSVTPDAPIVIYFAGHSFVSETDESAYLVPHLPNDDNLRKFITQPEKYCLPYSEIIDLLRHVADEKTDNILVILDSCHAGAMGRSPFDAPTPCLPELKLSDGPLGDGVLAGPSTAASLPSSLSRVPPSPSTALNGSPLAPKSPGQGLTPAGLEPPPTQAGHERDRRVIRKQITKATTEILIGHSSHLLLAGAAAEQQAYEDPGKGGQFTQKLLEVLKDAGAKDELRSLTYKKLVTRIQELFQSILVGKTGDTLLDYQTALCTTIYQDRYLFDGLFTRKVVDNTSSRPVIRVRYSD